MLRRLHDNIGKSVIKEYVTCDYVSTPHKNSKRIAVHGSRSRADPFGNSVRLKFDDLYCRVFAGN